MIFFRLVEILNLKTIIFFRLQFSGFIKDLLIQHARFLIFFYFTVLRFILGVRIQSLRLKAFFASFELRVRKIMRNRFLGQNIFIRNSVFTPKLLVLNSLSCQKGLFRVF